MLPVSQMLKCRQCHEYDMAVTIDFKSDQHHTQSLVTSKRSTHVILKCKYSIRPKWKSEFYNNVTEIIELNKSTPYFKQKTCRCQWNLKENVIKMCLFFCLKWIFIYVFFVSFFWFSLGEKFTGYFFGILKFHNSILIFCLRERENEMLWTQDRAAAGMQNKSD